MNTPTSPAPEPEAFGIYAIGFASRPVGRGAARLCTTDHSSLPIALYILPSAIIGFVSTAMLKDSTKKQITAEYGGV